MSGSKFNAGLNKMMGEAWKEVKSDFSGGSTLDKAASTAKLLGKGSLYLGVKLIQNIPAAVQRQKESLEESQAQRKTIETNYEEKRNSELVSIVKNTEIDEEKRRVAYAILKKRKEDSQQE